MKTHRIAGILSTTLAASLFFSQSLLGQQNNAQQSNAQQANASQSSSQPATQQTPDATQQQQPAAQPTQNTVPAQTQTAPNGQTQQALPQGQQQPANPSGTKVNPSQAPLAPITTYPDASGAQQEQQPGANAPQTNLPEGPQPRQQQQTEPVGAAAAERVPTAGGAAAKPAGVAIAPAKQHQTRSLLIKVGAALAAGAAVGTVFALSHSSPSTPPGSGLPGVTQK